MATVNAQTMANLLNRFYAGWHEAKGRKLGMLKGGLGELQKVAGMYGPGYMAGQEKLALTGAKSALASRGLGGTTRPQGVSAGMKAGFEDVRRQAKAGAMTNIAQYMAGWQEDEATPANLAYLATGGFGAGIQQQGMEMQQQAAADARRTPGPGEAGFMGGGWSLSDVGTRNVGGSMGGISTPGSPYGGIGGGGAGGGEMAGAAAAQPGGEFGPPTEYYRGGGGWQNWETTGGKVFGDVGASTMAGVTAGQTGGGDPIMQKAAQLWAQDAAAQGIKLGDTSVEKYKSLLGQTPRNTKRGVWKAWSQAGGS